MGIIPRCLFLIAALGVGWAIPALMQSDQTPPDAGRLVLPVVLRQYERIPGDMLGVASTRLEQDIKLMTVGHFEDRLMVHTLMLSVDGGLSWSAVPMQPWQALGPGSTGLLFDRLSARIIVVDGKVKLAVLPDWQPDPVLYVSQDLGQSWRTAPLPAATDCDSLTRPTLLATPAAADRLIFSAGCATSSLNDQGVFVTHDLGATWDPIDPWSLAAAMPYDILLTSAVEPGRLIRLTASGWQRSNDLGATWQGLSVPGQTLYLSPNNALVLASTDVDQGHAWSSADGGATWSEWQGLPCADGGLDSVAAPIWLRGISETLVAVCSDNSLIRSTDLGQSWTALDLPDGDTVSLLLAADDGSDRTLFVAGHNALLLRSNAYRSLDGGEQWQAVLGLSSP